MVDDETAKILEYTVKELLSLGIFSFPYKIEKHTHQGYMSQVFIIFSAGKEFVIHIAKPSQHHETYKTWEKLKATNIIVREKTQLPISEMIFVKPINGTFVTVQTRLPGEIAGSRGILGHSVVDEWFKEKESLIFQIQNALAEIHSIGLAGFGLPILKNGKLTGIHKTWRDFFIEEIPVWLKSLKQSEYKKGSTNNLYARMTDYTKKFSIMIPESSPFLIHGDLANPSNVLIQGDKVTGIIDWEWSIIGDPAWEFCDPGWATNIANIGLDAYFQARKIDKNDDKDAFLKRIILYRPLWCLWTAYIHHDDEDPIIYDTLCTLMEEALSEINTLKY